IDSNSASYISYLKAHASSNFVQLSGTDSSGSWAPTLFWAATTDSVYTVKNTGWGLPPEFASMRIPDGAQPGPGSDHEMYVYDLQKGYIAGFYNAHYDASSDTWSAEIGRASC